MSALALIFVGYVIGLVVGVFDHDYQMRRSPHWKGPK